MKKVLSLVLMIIVLFCCSACNDNGTSNNSSDLIINAYAPFYDINNNQIGEFEAYSRQFLTDDGLVYSKMVSGVGRYISTYDYYKYAIETNEKTKLGTIEDVSYTSAESVFMDGHLYFMVCVGDLTKDYTLKLMDADLKNNSLSELFSLKNTSPYNTMIGLDGKLLLGVVMSHCSYVEEINPKTKERKTLLSFDFDKENQIGETVIQIAADDTTVSLLMTDKNGENSVKLKIDVYDRNMNFLRSTDISGISEDQNELIQSVREFFYTDNRFYYQNFSSTQLLGTAENNEVSKLHDFELSVKMANETVDNNEIKLFIQPRVKIEETPVNYIYKWDVKENKLTKTAFRGINPNYVIGAIYRDSHDNLLVSMSGRDENGKIHYLMHYIKLSDLEFADIES